MDNIALGTAELYLEPTFRRALVIWWALLWRSVLLGLPSGVIVGFIEGFVGALVGVPQTLILMLTSVSGMIVGVLVGLCVVRHILRKNFREFSIRLVPAGTATISSVLHL